jgi:hypothetical protein
LAIKNSKDKVPIRCHFNVHTVPVLSFTLSAGFVFVTGIVTRSIQLLATKARLSLCQIRLAAVAPFGKIFDCDGG